VPRLLLLTLLSARETFTKYLVHALSVDTIAGSSWLRQRVGRVPLIAGAQYKRIDRYEFVLTVDGLTPDSQWLGQHITLQTAVRQ